MRRTFGSSAEVLVLAQRLLRMTDGLVTLACRVERLAVQRRGLGRAGAIAHRHSKRSEIGRDLQRAVVLAGGPGVLQDPLHEVGLVRILRW